MRIDLLKPPEPIKQVRLAAEALERYERGDTANARQMMKLALGIASVEHDVDDALEEMATSSRRYANEFGNTLQWLEDHGAQLDTGPINRVAAASDFFAKHGY